MQTNILALKTIKCYLKAVYWNRGIVVVLFFCSITLLVVLLTYPLVLEVFRFFFPLLLSTGMCVTAVYEFILSENHHGRGGGEFTNFEEGNYAGIRVLEAPRRRYSQFTFRMEDACVEVACVPLVDVSSSNSMDEYVENESSYPTVVKVLVLMEGEVGRVAENNVGCEEEEQISSSRVHSFAEGVWNCYFGREIISDDK